MTNLPPKVVVRRGLGGQVRVRRAEPPDVPAMAALELHTALTAYAHIFPPDAAEPTVGRFERRWRERLAGQGLVLVAQPEGGQTRIVATVNGAVDAADARLGHLQSLYVHPDWWGRGIGRRLHEAVVDHLTSESLCWVALWVLEANTRARSMYERWGWTQTDARQTMWPGVDEVGYRLDLPRHAARRTGQTVPRSW
jgi:GNAT superfamily N-acetyltransferase